MSKILCVDIETILQPKENFPQNVQEWMTEKFADKRFKEPKLDEKKMLKFPELGKIICIGTEFVDRSYGWRDAIPCEESQLLTTFWQVAAKASRFLTFNGKAFDIPFIIKRSILLGVKPTKVLPLKKYDIIYHCDLLEVISQWDRQRWMPLDIFGSLYLGQNTIGSGNEIHEWYKNKEFDKIIEHNKKDIELTIGLFKKIAPFFGIPME